MALISYFFLVVILLSSLDRLRSAVGCQGKIQRFGGVRVLLWHES